MNTLSALSTEVLASLALLTGNAFAAIGDPSIRIQTAYTLSAWNNSSLYGGSINTIVATQIAQLNAAFQNSGIALYAELAGTNLTLGSWAGAIPGADGVAADYRTLKARDDSNADVVVLIMYTGAVPPSGVNGRALSMPATATTAFAAVELSGISGYTYQHEFGHLIGAGHNEEASPTTAYPYAHGHWVRNYEVGSAWWVCFHTIVSYASPITSVPCTQAPGDERVLYYSSPLVYLRLSPTGTATHDNARVLRMNGPIIGTYRNVKLAPPLTGKIIVNIITDLLF